MPISPRLRAVVECDVASAREYLGLHDLDGVVQDLSPHGVPASLARLGGDALDDPHDEAALSALEAGTRVGLGELALHRSNPIDHIANLDLACYDRDYAPVEGRRAARARHLAGWPDAVDGTIASLDRVAAPVAQGLLGAVKGLAADVTADEPGGVDALVAHERLVDHIERCAAEGPSDAAMGGADLERLLSSTEAIAVDLDDLAATADDEIARLTDRLAADCAAIRPGQAVGDVVAELQADRPDAAGVLDEARALTQEVLDWTHASGLLPPHGGECLVGPAPPSRSWAMAMLSPAAPYEAESSSWYHVTPPDPSWSAEEQDAWLEVFNRTSLPAITVHEVAPGHFSHFRILRERVTSDVRRCVLSPAFIEGWAHDVEELAVDEGFRDGDPRYAIGVWLEALVRAVRLAVSIGVHTGRMTVDDATERFTAAAHIHGPAARSEAARATFDPTYGRYTWGKLAIRALRDEARRTWGSGYTHLRFHTALLDLGAPPLGLMRTALDRG